MSVFSAAINAIFADPNMAADAVYSAVGVCAPCRVILTRPDQDADFGQSMVRVPTVRADVRASEVASPEKGATLTVGDVVYRINAAPMRDRERLVWSLDLVEL
jgi:hypothetical protein